jgi:HEPN superfamily AbiU2-like protein
VMFFLRALQQQMKRLAKKVERERIVLAALPVLSVRIIEHANDLELIGKYRKEGPCHNVLANLRTLRNERLAHRQTAPSPATAPGASATDEEIEEFYQDNSKLVQILLSLVKAMAYDPQDTAGVYGFYAKSFWERFQPNPRKTSG